MILAAHAATGGARETIALQQSHCGWCGVTSVLSTMFAVYGGRCYRWVSDRVQSVRIISFIFCAVCKGCGTPTEVFAMDVRDAGIIDTLRCQPEPLGRTFTVRFFNLRLSAARSSIDCRWGCLLAVCSGVRGVSMVLMERYHR